eukprot:2479607-Ditylum_brightwellii.AAC.1
MLKAVVVVMVLVALMRMNHWRICLSNNDDHHDKSHYHLSTCNDQEEGKRRQHLHLLNIIPMNIF